MPPKKSGRGGRRSSPAKASNGSIDSKVTNGSVDAKPLSHLIDEEAIRKKTKRELKEWLNFYKIHVEADEEVDAMTDEKRRQYMCRMKRWRSLMTNEVEYYYYRATKGLAAVDNAIKHTLENIDRIRDDKDFDKKYDNDYKQKLSRVEAETNAIIERLAIDRDPYDQLTKQFASAVKTNGKAKSIDDEDMDEINEKSEEEVDSDGGADCDNGSDAETDEDVSVKEEEEDYEEKYDVKNEVTIKEEPIDINDDEDVDTKVDVKPIKREIKSEIKREIKSEIKREFKREMKAEIKKEEMEESVDSD